MKVRHKKQIKSVSSMSKSELADYLMTMKPSHAGYGRVAKEYLRRQKK